MELTGWEHWETITGVLVDLTILAGAVLAVVKFRLYNLFGHRFRSEVICSHVALSDGRVLFRGNYIVHNTGERQIWLDGVNLKLLRTRTSSDGLIEPDDEGVLAERTLARGGEPYNGLHRLEAGERSIFTLRCVLNDLDDVVFFVCKIQWPYRRDPSPYIALYVKPQGGGEVQREVAEHG